MNTQEAYEKIRAWLGRPDATKCTDGPNCIYYRGEDGNRCAIGALFPEEMVREMVGPDFQDDIQGVCREWSFVEKFLQGCDMEFLLSAQQIHDTQPYIEKWVPVLDELAFQYNLEVVA
jgi:hypothetical protein